MQLFFRVNQFRVCYLYQQTDHTSAIFFGNSKKKDRNVNIEIKVEHECD